MTSTTITHETPLIQRRGRRDWAVVRLPSRVMAAVSRRFAAAGRRGQLGPNAETVVGRATGARI
jgi:hypothetical protein